MSDYRSGRVLFMAFALIGLNAGVNTSQACDNAKYSAHFGDVTRGINCDTTSVSPGQAGENITWTITTTCKDTNPYNTYYVDPASTPFASYFPTATIVAHQSSSSGLVTYSFTEVTPDSSVSLGTAKAAPSLSVLKYSDPLTTSLCSATGYGQSYIDTFAYKIIVVLPGVSTVRHTVGIVTTTIDGEGRLVLPWVTFNHALRTREITTRADSTYTVDSSGTGPALVVLSVDTSFNWSDTSFYLADFSISYTNTQVVSAGKPGAVVSSKVVTYSEPVKSTGAYSAMTTTERSPEQGRLIATNGKLAIRSDIDLTGGTVRLYDLQGKKVGMLMICNRNALGEIGNSAHSLANLAYCYMLNNNQGVVVGKGFVVLRESR